MQYFSYILLAIHFVLVINHLVFAYLRMVKKKSGFSYVPFFNGFIGLGGIALYQEGNLSLLWLVPFIIDWGCLPMLVEMAVFKRFCKTPTTKP